MGTCIHHDGALGDAVLSLPCIQGIARGLGAPDMIGRGDVGKLVASLGVIRHAHDAGGGRFSQWHSSHPEDEALDLLSRYDRAFVFTVRPDSELVRNIRERVPDTRIIVTVPAEKDRTHVAEFRLRQLPPELRFDVRGGLAVAAAIREQAMDALALAGRGGRRPFIVLHPGSGGQRKCWPLERYFALAERLASSCEAFILFVAGPAEEGGTTARIERFVRGAAGMGCLSGRELPLVAGLLAQSVLYIGNDSGITHLAAAVGAPVIALFGHTDPALWAPRGARVRVIAAGTPEDIELEAVLAAAEAAVGQAVPR